MMTQRLLGSLLLGTLALAGGAASASERAPGERHGPTTITSDSRVLARSTTPVNGQKRSLLTGTLVGNHTKHDEVWDVTIGFSPRQELPPVLGSPWHLRVTQGPAVNRVAPIAARLIVRATSVGRTLVVGTALHDFGYGSDGVLMDGDVTLSLVRKVRLAPHFGSQRIDELATSGVLDDPEASGEVTYRAK